MKPTRIRVFLATMVFAVSMSRAQNVVTDWNAIASHTIVSPLGKPVSFAPYFAFTSIAVYDAVNSIHGRFRPFYFAGVTDRNASDEAAAIAAAHRVLLRYFPGQQADLDAQFNQSLGNLAASERAKQEGVEAGEAAAQALIAARTGDGLEADVPYLPGTDPGDWQPTPPGFLAPAVPWMGKLRPFTMKNPSQFRAAGPYALSSEEWASDYNLTRLFGDAQSTLRTPGQTEIGLFWTEHAGQQYARAWNYLVQNYKLNVMDSARLMAILWTGLADALIGCFDAKYEFGFWRPVTAIRAGGGNAELTADPGWTPLGITPNHPEYPSAHGCGSSAVSTLVADFFGTPKVHVVVDSLAFSDGIHTHTFESTAAWFDEVFWARIYIGFHFHHALQDGAEMGRRIGAQLFQLYFQPLPPGRRGESADSH